MADYPGARAAIATIIGAVAIASPVAVSIAKVYQFRPDGGEGLNEYPHVLITGFAMRYQRFAGGTRERQYTIGLRLAVRPVTSSAAAMQDILEAFKEAISAAFDQSVTLDAGTYNVVEGPNWISAEPGNDGGAMWDEGQIIVQISDSATFAA